MALVEKFFRKAVEADSLIALVEAVQFCSQHDQPQPDWLTKKVIVALCRDNASARKSELKNQIDYMRWDAVKELHDRKDELREQARLVHSKGDKRELREQARSIYKTAGRILEGTIAETGHEMIKKSFNLVERAMQSGDDAKYFACHTAKYFRSETRMRKGRPV